ncbi:hypothetical protein L6452_46594 [Arctium lappa]|nr:hypothetical protein L6452_46594 [Arctium lappa]
MGIVLQGGPHDSSVARAWPTTRAFGGRGPYCWSANRRRAHASELAVRRPGKAPKRPFPIRPPAGTRRPALAAEAARAVRRQPTGSGLGPPCPAPQSNPFPEVTDPFCRLPLAYIVPSTRGCSPWRPDAVMSTTGRGRPLGPPDFQGPPGAHRTPRDVSAQFGTVTRLPVHPASPVLLTKNGPLGALDSVARLNEAAAPSYLFKV